MAFDLVVELFHLKFRTVDFSRILAKQRWLYVAPRMIKFWKYSICNSPSPTKKSLEPQEIVMFLSRLDPFLAFNKSHIFLKLHLEILYDCLDTVAVSC